MTQAAAESPTPSVSPVPPAAAEPIAVRRADLPLACPLPKDSLWNMHPRVYLPIEDEPSFEAMCPYCGARYRLVD